MRLTILCAAVLTSGLAVASNYREVAKAVGDKKGLRRFGHAYVPLDEALSRVVIDFSGRPGLVMNVPFKAGAIKPADCDC